MLCRRVPGHSGRSAGSSRIPAARALRSHRTRRTHRDSTVRSEPRPSGGL
jgi:hypothetical protein